MVVDDRALGLAKPLTEMSGEFAGVVTAVGSEVQALFKIGDRVCGWRGIPYARRTFVNASFVQRMPASRSFAEGASIPLALQMAYHDLIGICRLQKQQTVPIYSAAGTVGQAAVMIAKYIGAEIFATFGDYKTDCSKDSTIRPFQTGCRTSTTESNFRHAKTPYSLLVVLFFSHPLSKTPHGQAESAAIIASTAFKYKQRLEAGEIGEPYMNELPLSTDLYQWGL